MFDDMVAFWTVIGIFAPGLVALIFMYLYAICDGLSLFVILGIIVDVAAIAWFINWALATWQTNSSWSWIGIIIAWIVATFVGAVLGTLLGEGQRG